MPIELNDDDWKKVASAAGSEVTIDLDSGSITLHGPGSETTSIRFSVPEAQRNRLLNGLDAIAETLQDEEQITAYERNSPAWASGKAG